MKTNKLAQLVIDRTVVLIIAVMVIFAVGGIFIYFNPNFFYRLLPEFNTPTDTGDEVISGADVLTSNCKDAGDEIVGFIFSTGDLRKGGNIRLGSKGEKETSLFYRETSSNNANIVIDDSWFDKGIWFFGKRLFADTILGTVKNNLVSIDSQYLIEGEKFLTNNKDSSKPLLVTVEDLSILNGASFEGQAFFCKHKEIEETEEDIIALAQMMQGEEGNQGEEAMKAVGAVAINRWIYVQSKAGFGVSKGASLSQVIGAANQFQGYKPTNDYSKSLNIAKEVLANKISSVYSGYYYFGNNIPLLDVQAKMVDCQGKNSNFNLMQVGKTTLYLSNGDYTSSSCEIPLFSISKIN